MATNFNIKLINGEIVESDEDNHFFILPDVGACSTLEGFLEYSKNAHNIAVTAKYGNKEKIKRVIPKISILEYVMKHKEPSSPPSAIYKM